MNSLEFEALMAMLSVPRPTGSRAEAETGRALMRWLRERGIACHVHRFRQRPYFFECVGAWLLTVPTLLYVEVWLGGGWLTVPLALLAVTAPAAEIALGWTLLTWPGRRAAANVVARFATAAPVRELVVSAHYDSKTELLDHRQRLFFLRNLVPVIGILFVLGASGPIGGWALEHAPMVSGPVHAMAALLTLPALFLTGGLGLNLVVGRFLEPSQGAVDNGAACAILLGLADELASGKVGHPDTTVTLVWFTAEEANMQGSADYVRSRSWPLPTWALNLEIMGQDGDYVVWEQDGSVFRLGPTSRPLNRVVADAVTDVTGTLPRPAGSLISDARSFLSAGIPATTLGTHSRTLGDRGLHRPLDHRDRVDLPRLLEGVRVLERFLERVDLGEAEAGPRAG